MKRESVEEKGLMCEVELGEWEVTACHCLSDKE